MITGNPVLDSATTTITNTTTTRPIATSSSSTTATTESSLPDGQPDNGKPGPVSGQEYRDNSSNQDRLTSADQSESEEQLIRSEINVEETNRSCSNSLNRLINQSFVNSFHGPVNLIPNDISIMQESTDLHWFNEETYQSEKNGLVVNMPVISDSSHTDSSHRNGTHRQHHRYQALSRNIDATLAEIDMETFRSEDINHLYSTLPELDSSCGPVNEDGGEEYASVTGSLLEEIHSDSNYLSSKRFGNSHGLDLNGSSLLFDSSLIDDPSRQQTLSSSTMKSEHLLPGLYERSRLDVSGVSIDSLDFSSSENDNNTHEVILRCREQDKTKYTIAFEESVSSITTFSDSADDSTKNNSEESDTVTQFNHHHRSHHNYQPQQLHPRRRRFEGNLIGVNSSNGKHSFDLDGDTAADGDDDDDDYNVNDLIRSEYTTWNMAKRRPFTGSSSGKREMTKLRRTDPFRSLAKQSQSLPNIVQVSSAILHGGEPLFPPLGSYVPLYDLNKSNTTTNSSASEVSPPRSLIRLFIKNRNSPTSSSPGSSSTSFEGHLIESSELSRGHQGSIRYASSGYRGPGDGSHYYEGKESKVVSGRRNVSQQCFNENWQNTFEDSLVGNSEGALGGAAGQVNFLTAKAAGFNRLKQASPIREEDVASDASRGDEAIASGTDESYHGNGLNFKGSSKLNIHQWPAHDNHSGKVHPGNLNVGARRSISVDRFMSTQCGGGGNGGPSSSSGTSNNNIRRSSDYGSTNMNKIRFSSGREFGSVSSGYLSSRQGSSEWQRKTNFTPYFQPQLHYQHQATATTTPSSCNYPLHPSSSSGSIPAAANRKYSISVTTMKTASTQVPVHIQDKQVQTASSKPLDETNTDPNGANNFMIREYPTSTPSRWSEKTIPLSCYPQESPHPGPNENSSRKPLYVCFPNYSLPDLSFLKTFSCPCTPKDEGPSTVYLSPTKLKLPLKEFSPASGIRQPFGRKGIRPKSCTDYENLIANRNFNHIKDWDSLKVLLPNELKSLIARLEGESRLDSSTKGVNQTETDIHTTNIVGNTCNLSCTNPFSANYRDPTTTSSPPTEVKLRPRKKPSPAPGRESRPSHHHQSTLTCPCQEPNVISDHMGSCGCQERKRHSLQEPASGYGTQPEPGSSACPYRNTISRSVTMPSCVCHTPPHPVCHLNCCQSGSYYPHVTNQSLPDHPSPPHHNHHPHHHHHHHPPSHGSNHLYSHQSSHQSTAHLHKVHSIASSACCQGGTGMRPSMSPNVNPAEMNSSLVNGLFDDPSVDRLCHLLSKGISVKDFTNIIGSNSGSGSGVTHKTRLISPSKPYQPIKEQVIEETDSMCVSSTKELEINCETKLASNEMRGADEDESDGYRDCLSNADSNNNELMDEQPKDGNNNCDFNVVTKRWESPASSVPEAEAKSKPVDKRNSRSDNSQESSTTTTALTSSKPKVPVKPPLSSLRPSSVPVAKRPTTLGANANSSVFRSMIPVAKSVKSPPTVKPLTSPNNKTLPRAAGKRS